MGHLLKPARLAPPARLAHVDALRALGALAVALHHLGGDLAHDLGFDFGRYGVLVFFAVSGYVVPYSLSAAHTRPLLAFGLSRAFRLYPAYWLSLAVVVALGDAHPGTLQLLANLTMAQRFLGVADIHGVYWTLAVELVFYLGCAALFAAGVLARLKPLLLVLATLSAATLAAALLRALFGWPLPFAWLGFLSLMIGGAVLRRLDDDGLGRDARILPAAAVVLAVQVAAVVLVYQDPAHARPAAGEAGAWTAAAASFLLFRHFHLAPPGAAYLGRISYSLYLLHGPVGMAVAAALPGPLALPLGFAAAIAAAAAAFHLVEQPMVRLGHRLARRVAPRTVLAESPS